MPRLFLLVAADNLTNSGLTVIGFSATMCYDGTKGVDYIMSVIRIHKTNNYTIMANHHFKEKQMSLKAKGLLSLMLSLPDDWNYSVSGLVKLSKDGKDGVMSALAELEKFGYLTRRQQFNAKGQFSGIEYNIFEEPQQENTITDKQDAAKPISANQYAENPPQLNTNQSITKNNNKITNESSTNAITDADMYALLVDIDDTDLAELYREYTEWRATTDAPLTKQGLKMLIKRCERLSEYNVSIQKAMVETALIQQWKNVFSPKQEEKQGVLNEVAEEHAKIFFGR